MPIPLLPFYSWRAPFFLVFIAMSHCSVCQMEDAEALAPVKKREVLGGGSDWQRGGESEWGWEHVDLSLNRIKLSVSSIEMELSSSPTGFDPVSRDGGSYVFSFLLFEPICTFAGEIQSTWAHSFNSLSCCLIGTILRQQTLPSSLLAATISCLWRTWAPRSEMVVL